MKRFFWLVILGVSLHFSARAAEPAKDADGFFPTAYDVDIKEVKATGRPFKDGEAIYQAYTITFSSAVPNGEAILSVVTKNKSLYFVRVRKEGNLAEGAEVKTLRATWAASEEPFMADDLEGAKAKLISALFPPGFPRPGADRDRE